MEENRKTAIDLEEVKESVLSAVDEMIESGSSPETERAMERLICAGCTAKEARLRIASMVVQNICTHIRAGEEYPIEQYEADLRMLA